MGETGWCAQLQSGESSHEDEFTDLKTPFEKALNDTKWKEYFSGGRKYYYNVNLTLVPQITMILTLL
jgi:hypothetical protein